MLAVRAGELPKRRGKHHIRAAVRTEKATDVVFIDLRDVLHFLNGPASSFI
jgi:hypothetical protein